MGLRFKKDIIMKVNTSRIIRYLTGGTLGAISNLVVLFVFVQYLNVWYLTSTMVSFSVGAIVSYIAHKFWTFENYSLSGIHLQFTAFLIFNFLMLGLNTLLMYVLVEMTGIWYLFSQILVGIVIAIINYTFFRKYIFNREIF